MVPLNTIGIVEVNSVDYIQHVFDALAKGKAVVPLRSSEDELRLRYLAVEEIVEPQDCAGWCDLSLQLPSDKAIVHIAFTSGTEGEPKGVLLSSLALNDVVERIQLLMQMDSSVREYVGVPVYHSFGYARCRHVASVGGRFYIPAQGFDPREVASLLKSREINSLSLVPSLLRVFLQNPSLLGVEAESLAWLEIGSQSMSADEKKQVRELFPNAIIVQHYGLTEASRSSLLRIDNAELGVLDSVGSAIGDVEIKVDSNNLIQIKGSHVATHLLVGGKISLVVDPDGWLTTSDLGYLKGGFLYYLGRADNVVNCAGQKLSTEQLFQAINEKILNVSDAIAVSRIDHDMYGEGFLVSYIDGTNDVLLKSVVYECLSSLGIKARNAVIFYSVDDIPKTHTGKVQNKALVDRYKAFFASEERQGEVLNASPVLNILAEALNTDTNSFNASSTIMSIGIDSMQSVQVSIQLESHLGYLPRDWRCLTVEELEGLPQRHEVPLSPHDSNGNRHHKVFDSTAKAAPLWDGSSNMNPVGISFWSLLKEDYVTHDRDWASQGFFALFVNRFGNWRMGVRYKLFRFPLTLIYRVLIKMVQMMCGIKLDYTVHVGRRVKLEHFGGMILGARKIGDDVVIRQNTTFGIRDMSDLSAKPTIEAGVNIGVGVVIVGDITVGRHSIIGPNSVITNDVPAFSVVSAGKSVVVQDSK